MLMGTLEQSDRTQTAGVASGRRVRFAIGLFTGPSSIGSALSALARGGVPRDRVQLVAPSNAFNGALENWISATDRDSDHRDFGQRVVSASAGDVCPWAGPTLSHKLDAHLSGGGGIVVVEFATEAEERASLRALLAHAGASVQTHDVRLPS